MEQQHIRKEIRSAGSLVGNSIVKHLSKAGAAKHHRVDRSPC